MADEDIVTVALEEERVVVTLDADFSALLALSGAAGPSVMHLRIEGLRHREAARAIANVIGAFHDELTASCIASITPGGVRVRRLPIRPVP